MASYGLFLAVCGYEHHGPKGRLGFDPRPTPDDFRCPFTAAGCWGTYSQSRTDDRMTAEVRVGHGSLRLNTLMLVPRDAGRTATVRAEHDGAASLRRDGRRVEVVAAGGLSVGAGQTFRVSIQHG